MKMSKDEAFEAIARCHELGWLTIDDASSLGLGDDTSTGNYAEYAVFSLGGQIATVRGWNNANVAAEWPKGAQVSVTQSGHSAKPHQLSKHGNGNWSPSSTSERI